jgi:MinD-like ATPase involved in chromosome partitioning or flagellar assembly
MRRMLVTVVGSRKRINLAVSAGSAIRELMPSLAERCAEPTRPLGDGERNLWSLYVSSPSGPRLLPSDSTLHDCGVGDGAVLYLKPRAGLQLPTAASALQAAEAAPGDPRKPARAVLPARVGTRGRLSLLSAALRGRAQASPGRSNGQPEAVPSPADLTPPRPQPLGERVRAAWQSTNYVVQLNAMIAEPRLQRCVTIAIMSPKGGVGKTTLAALIGTLFATIRRDRVVAVDTNPDYGSLGRSLTPGHDVFVDDLIHLLETPALSVTALDAKLGRGPDGLMVLPAPTEPGRMARLDEETYVRVITRLQGLVGVVILDCGTGLHEPAAKAALRMADQVLLVTDGEPATASLVAEASQPLVQVRRPLLLVVNKMSLTSPTLDLDALARYVPEAWGPIVIPEAPQAASSLGAGRFSWANAPAAWRTSVRELGAALVAGWAELGLTL